MIAFDRALHNTRWYYKAHYTYTIWIRSRSCFLIYFTSVKADDITATGGRNRAVKVSQWVSKHWTGNLKLSTSSVEDTLSCSPTVRLSSSLRNFLSFLFPVSFPLKHWSRACSVDCGLSTERNISMRNFAVYITRHFCLTRNLWSRARLPNELL
jgi:hypothetical protein